MEMFQVRYVLAAARLPNFTKAAAQCNVSQPAMTKAIKTLEAKLGALKRAQRSGHERYLTARAHPTWPVR